MLRFIGGGGEGDLSRDKWALSIDNGGRKAQSRQYDGQSTAQERNRADLLEFRSIARPSLRIRDRRARQAGFDDSKRRFLAVERRFTNEKICTFHAVVWLREI